MNKRTILVIFAVIIGVAAFLFLTRPADNTEQGTPSSHMVGSNADKVTLIEYGDFQCPACGQYYPVLKQVKETYGDRITFQFRHFPLESIHINARAGSRAAEAAGLQGKFWEMHDILFERQASWQSTNDPMNTFVAYAQEIGVPDIEKFREDYRSSAVNAVINADLNEGRSIGASSTPTFVLNGKKLDDNPPAMLEAFKAIIDPLLEEDMSNNSTNNENSANE